MDERQKEIIDLLKQGRKLEAVKLFRELAGVDLKQALEEIEYIAAGLENEPGQEPMTPAPPEIPEEVRKLALEGKKIEAIKILRHKTGLGLKEAKDQVDEIAGVRSGGTGCFGIIVLCAGTTVLAFQLFG